MTQELEVWGSALSPGSLAFLEEELTWNWCNWNGFFDEGNKENYQSRNLNIQGNSKTSSFAITVYFYYEWKDPNTEEKRCLKIKLLQMKAA